jgi:hypothetical protein
MSKKNKYAYLIKITHYDRYAKLFSRALYKYFVRNERINRQPILGDTAIHQYL